MEDDSAPATRKDLHDLESRLDAKFDDLESRLDAKLDAKLEALQEQIRDGQTELLKAFLPWQQQVQIQFREIEVNTGNSITAVKERMNILERRLTEIEKKLLINPPAA